MKCQLSGKHVCFGNNVSHSNRKTRRTFVPNISSFLLYSKIMKRKFRMKLAVSTMRTIDKKGGIDEFLLTTSNRKLTAAACALKKCIIKCNASAV